MTPNHPGGAPPRCVGRAAAEPATVVVRLGGGLGNQLFQYAFGRRMAVANGATLVLDASGYKHIERSDARLGVRGFGLQHFNIQATVDTEGSPMSLPERPWIKRKFVKWSRILGRFVEAQKPRHLQKIVIEPPSRHFRFDPTVYNREIRGTVVFEGYWQTEKYFIEAEPLIRTELTVLEPLEGENARVAAAIQSCMSVAIHVRHGDNASGVETGLGILPGSYYEEAIERTRATVASPQFFVFSEDVDWAKSLLKLGSAAAYISHNDDMHNFEDLRLMTMCRHHIVANSTFSWWGAWLGKEEGQIVYAPRRYWQNLDRPNPDLYPEDWYVI